MSCTTCKGSGLINVYANATSDWVGTRAFLCPEKCAATIDCCLPEFPVKSIPTWLDNRMVGQFDLLDRWALDAPSIPDWFMPPPISRKRVLSGLCADCDRASANPFTGIETTDPCPNGDLSCEAARARYVEATKVLRDEEHERERARETAWPYHWAALQMAERKRAIEAAEAGGGRLMDFCSKHAPTGTFIGTCPGCRTEP